MIHDDPAIRVQQPTLPAALAPRRSALTPPALDSAQVHAASPGPALAPQPWRWPTPSRAGTPAAAQPFRVITGGPGKGGVGRQGLGVSVKLGGGLGRGVPVRDEPLRLRLEGAGAEAVGDRA
jgi:hypothetical protein